MNDRLEGNEKIIVWIAILINPVLAGGLYYFMWRKSFPGKAKSANQLSFLVIFIEICIFLVYLLLKYYKL